jgi:hypothetical protein
MNQRRRVDTASVPTSTLQRPSCGAGTQGIKRGEIVSSDPSMRELLKRSILRLEICGVHAGDDVKRRTKATRNSVAAWYFGTQPPCDTMSLDELSW